MIIVRLSGGLGNQMFQYAFGKSISILNNQELKFDTIFFEKQDFRKLEITNYSVDINKSKNKEVAEVLFPRNFPLKWFSFITNKIWKYSDKYIKEKKSFSFDKSVLNLNGNFYFDGYWQNIKYFENIRETLLREYKIKEKLDTYSESIIKKMSESESVSLHVRAGDYLKIPEVGSICNMDYYQKAISYIKGKISNPVFFVFSEDKEYVKKMLPSNLKYEMINSNIGKPHIDLYLMSKCRHNIIANSSFSWWSAWLNQNQNKIIVSPKTWHTNSKEREIILDNWVKI